MASSEPYFESLSFTVMVLSVKLNNETHIITTCEMFFGTLGDDLRSFQNTWKKEI